MSDMGGLVVVGTGIELGRHITARALSEIRAADEVFCIVDPYTLGWLRDHRPDVVNLGEYYADGKDRRRTYREMEAAIHAGLERGSRVCAVLYGHPGVFAEVGHNALHNARQAGFPARMEPGISAEGCLYADLGLDPGTHGVQSFEATRFLIYGYQADPSALLILWQVALAGDLARTRFNAEPAGLQALVAKLLRWYEPATPVILYEAAQVVLEPVRADRLALSGLPRARFREHTTLIIPPVTAALPDQAALNDLGQPACLARQRVWPTITQS